MNKILEINNVTKYYGSGSVVTKALNGISFSVEKGSLRPLWEHQVLAKVPF